MKVDRKVVIVNVVILLAFVAWLLFAKPNPHILLW